MGVRAFRTWNIGSKGIKSGLDPDRWDNPTWWNPGINYARCAFHDHFAPDKTCRCGFRGNPDYDNLLWWLYQWKGVDCQIIGVVELGGEIVQGDQAHLEIPGILRAATAEIVGPIVVNSATPPMVANHLARRFGVKVHTAKAWTPGHWLKTVDRSVFDD